MNIKKSVIIAIVLLTSFFGVSRFSFAESLVNITIRNGDSIIYTGSVPLRAAGTIQLNGHNLDADSVLSVLNDADTASESFSITDLQYYNSLGSFYLKCINSQCDNWQYRVNGLYSESGVDKNTLSGGENVYFYFGPQHKITLNSNSITTKENLIIDAQNYAYESNSWEPLTNFTIGITQPDPNNPWTPFEIKIKPISENGQVVFDALIPGQYNVGIKEDFYSPSEILIVRESVASYSGSSGSSIIRVEPISFNYSKALDFISLQQKENGSFGEEIYTDWASLALASSDNYKDQKTKLVKYFTENKMVGTNLTDYERHSIALMALGIDPSNINGENYIQKIIQSFDGTQFGDKTEDNDDIFALIVLQNSGFSKEEAMINKTIDFIISRQKENGSWDESIDMTGVGVEALAGFKENEKVKKSLEKAKNYLKEKQKVDGSWGNISSTAWAIEGIIAIDEKIEDWNKNNISILEYLGQNQEIDGSIRISKEENNQSKLWQTSYVATSLSGKTWNKIMQKFKKVSIPTVELNVSSNQKIIDKKQLINKSVIKKQPEQINKIQDKNIEGTGKVDQIKNEEPKVESSVRKSFFRRVIEALFGIK